MFSIKKGLHTVPSGASPADDTTTNKGLQTVSSGASPTVDDTAIKPALTRAPSEGNVNAASPTPEMALKRRSSRAKSIQELLAAQPPLDGAGEPKVHTPRTLKRLEEEKQTTAKLDLRDSGNRKMVPPDFVLASPRLAAQNRTRGQSFFSGDDQGSSDSSDMDEISDKSATDQAGVSTKPQ